MSNSMIAQNGRMSLSAAFATPKFQQAIHNALNDAAREKTFVSSIIAASTINTVLQECTPQSVLSTALVGESLKLCPSPQLGHYYFVPYEVKVKGPDGRDVIGADGQPIKQKKAQFQIGYKGYIQLALRTGQYRMITVMAIKKGELRRWNPLTEELDIALIEDDNVRELTETIGYYAAFEYLNGFRKAMYWSKDKMKAHAMKYSQGYKKDVERGWIYTFWSKDFDGMAYKTMLRQLISKWGVMSTEMQQAMDADPEVVVREDGSMEVKTAELAAAEYPEAVDAEVMEAGAPAEDTQVSLDEL